MCCMDMDRDLCSTIRELATFKFNLQKKKKSTIYNDLN